VSKFLPTTREEMIALGWSQCDVVLISGDAYIDSPYIGVAVIGRILSEVGFRVGIIGQPEIDSERDIARLGEPRLFWGVSGGSVDSMVANYTATKKRRKSDDFTPGGQNTRRPDRAVIVYTNLIRRFFKGTVPIVLGGIEASLRRVTHYDYWSNRLRKPILFEAKADMLLYGMAEAPVVELARALDRGEAWQEIRGLSYIAKAPVENYLPLPSHAEALADKRQFITLFHRFYQNNDPITARGLRQPVDDRFLIQNPPAPYPAGEVLDRIYALPYTRDAHPIHAKAGPIKALETIRFSVTTHQGCYGECNFCAIAVHQGRTIRSRSEASILEEVRSFEQHPKYRGVIADVGGPTANMYGFECAKKLAKGSCEEKRCLFPKGCKSLKPTHKRQIDLLRRLRREKGVRHLFIASGIRTDLILDDRAHGEAYLQEILSHHVSGQMKIAPEHADDRVLALMGKPGKKSLLAFKARFDAINKRAKNRQFLTYYFIAAHPGCSEKEMADLKRFSSGALGLSPEQVQVFTPTPGTYSSLMYYTGLNPWSGESLFVERDNGKKEKQKRLLTDKERPRRGFDEF
jgi:uncharacterized radical SAM protein YgiQ